MQNQTLYFSGLIIDFKDVLYSKSPLNVTWKLKVFELQAFIHFQQKK